LSKASIFAAPEADVFIGDLIHRRVVGELRPVSHGALQVSVAERLASLSVDGLLKTIWLLGHAVQEPQSLTAGHGRYVPDLSDASRYIERAVLALVNWPTFFSSLLIPLLSAAADGSDPTSRALSSLHRFIKSEMQGEEVAFIRNVYEAQIKQTWALRDDGQNSRRGGQLEFCF
jgi:hypothetical protein